MAKNTIYRTLALALILLFSYAAPALAQADACTAVAAGTSQDITAHGVCKKVTFAGFNGVASVCAVTGTNGTEWASFYDNPPAGVTIGACSGGCSGYSYGGYCYYYSGDNSANSCDTTCAAQGGCNAAGTRYIGSDEPGSTRCSAVATALSGTPITASGGTTAGYFGGCAMNTIKGGWVGSNMYTPTTTCADVTYPGRICACNGGGGGTAPCNLPWGGTTPHNTSVTAYAAPTSCGACTSQTRTCTNGTLSGSYAYSSCSSGVCNCTLPWGQVLSSGQSNVLSSPLQYQSNLGCSDQPGYRCVNLRISASCSSGVATCTSPAYGTISCWDTTFTSCANTNCGGGEPPCCFVKEAQVTMADGSHKAISELKVGDKVKGEKGINTVLQVIVKQKREMLYGINGSKPFVTSGHPFKTQDGWKSMEPSMTKVEGHSVVTTKLEVGDTLYLEDGSTVEIKSIDPHSQTDMFQTYSPVVDGDNTYYSNGFLVHNKNVC